MDRYPTCLTRAWNGCVETSALVFELVPMATTTIDPVHALALLRQAQSSGARMRLRLAAGDGSLQERRVRVLAVEAGRVRLADVVRETELTVAVHRIAWVGEDA